MARVLANSLELVISDLIGPEQNYTVKARSIQDNLYLVCEVLKGLKDDSKAGLINLDQSNAFNWVDHRFLETVSETTGFKPEFRKWISMMYHNTQVVVQGNGRRSKAFPLVSFSLGPRSGAPAPKA